MIEKWYFDTAFSLTSVWHFDVACVVLRDNERENVILFGIPPLRHMCVFQNYKQRTTYLNWANHLVFSSLRHVCIPKLHTANHLVFSSLRHVCVPKLHTANHLFELS